MKQLIYIGAAVGGLVGGYIPVMFGDSNLLSAWSLLGSLAGGVIGIYLGYKLAKISDE